MASSANAIPTRRPAIPHAFEKVRSTTMFGCEAIEDKRDSTLANSAYASSTTTIPLKFCAIRMITSRSITLPVGLFGEQTNTIFVCWPSERRTSSASSEKSLRSGTSLTATSLISAETRYIPYVGGQMMHSSRPGSQNMRKRRSIASSLPLPIKMFSGRTLRIAAIRSFNSRCSGSG